MPPVHSSDTDSRRIGVLSFHTSKETKAILNAITDLGHDPVWLDERTVRTWMDGEVTRFEPAVDVVANRLLLTKSARPIEDLGLVAVYESACPVLNPADAVMRAINKYVAGVTLLSAGIPTPRSVMAFGPAAANNGQTVIKDRAVHKTAIGTNGGRMALVDPDEPSSPWLANRRAFLQEFIDTDTERPSDVRVYVVGDRLVGAMRRHAPADDWRTNVALGGAVEDITDELPDSAAELARRATRVLGLDYAGVDLIHGEEGWYVLEVNTTAGFKGLFDATGVSPAPYIAQLAIERAGGHVDESAVDALAATLDDSTPACRPDREPSSSERGTIGYTERVVVGGSRALETVVAKADTGAERTSIDVSLASTIGAGPITGTVRIKSGSQRSSHTRPLVDLDIAIRDNWSTVTASIEDRSHMRHPVLVGRDALQGYQVDVERRVTTE